MERIAAAAATARDAEHRIILTARTENYLHGRTSFDDTLTRLVAYAKAGADVVYAPGLSDPAEIERAAGEAGAPLNVLVLPNTPKVPELAALGVARVSVGSGFYLAAYEALAECGRELLEHGSLDFWKQAAKGAGTQKSVLR